MTKIILDNLCKYLKVKNYRGLALYLGVPVSRVYSWKKYGKISDVGLILVKNPELNPGWLYTGEGEMLDGELEIVRTDMHHTPGRISPTHKIKATIEPGPARKKRTNVKSSDIPIEEQLDSLNEEEAIEQTRYVLRSDTVYRGALVSNIRAFYQGVQREEEMAGVDERMTEMQSTMETMMRMLESLGAVVPGKKRDSQANE